MQKTEQTYELIGALHGTEPGKHLHFYNGHIGRAATPHITEGRKEHISVNPLFSLSAYSISPTHTCVHTRTHTLTLSFYDPGAPTTRSAFLTWYGR